MAQIKEAIAQRKEVKSWEDLKTVEWQTKNLASMIANTVDSKEGRQVLNDVVDEMSITGTPSKKKQKKTSQNQPKTYTLLTGEVIPASELHKYRYEEIDHTEEEAARIAEARKRNSGKNLMSMF